MRLDKIKLSGFKSFVDPTTLELRSPLVAVVGPNGCGKSNVIDAVRWVMGESSAKNLRGESMSDVIFNGSSSRKPVGVASIELIFDNSDGSLGGEYANYAEISIRRQASRDNQSSYFLNGVKCRRRDITDIFLGTGLGPRSYSIIEQGMISRVIEAKPEDLRAFFEEASGISLYRRRRHETEIRMRHTRENLLRLEDVRLELDKQLERLKRQSVAAERYQQLKLEQDTLDHELAALRWHTLKEQREEKAQLIRQLSTRLEEKLAGKTNIDLELEKCREQQVDKNEHYNSIHETFYELGTEIARNEQSLEHHRELKQQYQEDLEEAKQDSIKMDEQLSRDKNRLSELQEESIIVEPLFEKLTEERKHKTIILEETVKTLQQFQDNFEAFQSEAQNTQQKTEVEKARIEQLDKQSRDANGRLGRLQQELSILDWEKLQQAVFDLEQEIKDKEKYSLNITEFLKECTEILNRTQCEREEISQNLDSLKAKRQTHQGRLASLQALQQAALGKTDKVIKDWLQVANCEDKPRLAEQLEVEPGFERAVETVLGNALEAVCVDNLAAIMPFMSALEGSLNFLSNTSASIETVHTDEQRNVDERTLANDIQANSRSNVGANSKQLPLIPLASKVKSLYAVDSLLAGIYVAETLEEALTFRSELKPEESIVTKDGIWQSKTWLRVYRGSHDHAGVIEREAEIKTLEFEIVALTQNIETGELKERMSKEASQEAFEKRETHLAEEAINARLLKELTGKLSAQKTALEHTRNRLAQVQEEIDMQTQHLTLSQEEASLARLHLQNALDAMEDFKKRRENLLRERDALKVLVQQAEKQLNDVKEEHHVNALKRENLKTQLVGYTENIHRLEENRALAFERIRKCEASLQDIEDPFIELRNALEQLLENRLKIEETLNQARSVVQALENEAHILEKRRLNYEHEAEQVRAELDSAKMDWQALEIRSQTVQEKLSEVKCSVEELWNQLPEDAEESVWAERLTDVTEKISRLGAINLAAIEEFQTESERKNYLDLQYRDLTEALETLENAIRKIDKETRAKFKETFDKVNAEFQNLFPRLFGGGEAYLELSGEDLLEAGVAVMARPPGKRNSSIHLLSGGEKALTAVALVFAIFQLNPAPFCMLDEVDAPLDDANVGRFCELVKHMSSTVQFIYITHNKVSMEMAHHLVGVTMKEPGVSRLVTVDVAEAYAMVG